MDMKSIDISLCECCGGLVNITMTNKLCSYFLSLIYLSFGLGFSSFSFLGKLFGQLLHVCAPVCLMHGIFLV